MSEWKQEQDEKDEKDEKQQGEKLWGEKWQNDVLSGVIWALILIWAGCVLLLDTMGVLRPFPFLSGWSLIFLGAGLLLLVEAGVRAVLPSYRRGMRGRVILAFIFLGIGLGSTVGWALVWPLVIIAIGVIMILGVLVWNRR
ncbi:MAG: hypothetical protein KKA73_20695 [Chloroflexi bacterium]|nr:hypothetical protein [Chloroflexota bacterium]MBU1750110.1 hypothetical protein [Chloroflexota bacterium]